MINFNIQKVNQLEGGLIFQITGEYVSQRENAKISQLDFTHSLIISEYAFCMVETIFIQDKDKNYYHYGVHFYNKNELNQVVVDLEKFLKNITINNYQIDFHWATEELLEFFKKNQYNPSFQQKLKVFVQEVIQYLNGYLDDDACFGIYVIGI